MIGDGRDLLDEMLRDELAADRADVDVRHDDIDIDVDVSVRAISAALGAEHAAAALSVAELVAAEISDGRGGSRLCEAAAALGDAIERELLDVYQHDWRRPARRRAA